MDYATQLRKLISTHKILVAPGVFDGLSALLAQQAGFSLVYASGGAIARSFGYPDIGLLTLSEVSSVITTIVAQSALPVIADADTGFGNAINVRRTIECFERAGVAGLHLEDQTFPKRCGHLNDKSIISTHEMCLKIKVARATLSNPEVLIIARTDAIAVEGFAAAIQRANAYTAAGADMIFIEAPETVEQIEAIAKQVKVPKLINMFHGGKTPLLSVARLQELGYSVVIIPSDLQRATIKAMQKTLAVIKEKGNSETIDAQLTSFAEREIIVKTKEYLAISE